MRKKHAEDFETSAKHIAIIMDGNGRWAKKRGLPRTFGHKQGAEQIFTITKAAKKYGVKVLTIYAFSAENWKRPEDEINFLFRYLEDNFVKRFDELMENNIRVQTIGQLYRLPVSTQKVIQDTIERTAQNDGIILNIALSYGGRPEIISAIKNLITDVQAKKVDVNTIDEDLFATYLQTADLPPVDLLIRTSGELRVSNFMLWQIAYSEMIFPATLWPDFDERNLRECLDEFQRRQRRYGGL